MKTKRKLIFTVVLAGIIGTNFAQVSVLSTTRPFTGGTLGWTGGWPGPLEIRNDFNQPINIYTNGSQRMSIRPNGRVGINSANRLSLRM